MALLFLCLIFGTGRTQKIEAADTETDQAAAAQDELLAELDFDAIQQEVDSLLSSQQFSFAGTVRSLLQDGDPFRTFRAGNAVLSCAKTAFLAQKGLMKELFLLVLAGAVLGSFSSLFEGKQVRDASFYMVYLLALALILKNFQSSGENLKAVITSLIAFMRILTPSYYLAAAAAGGGIISRDVLSDAPSSDSGCRKASARPRPPDDPYLSAHRPCKRSFRRGDFVPYDRVAGNLRERPFKIRRSAYLWECR